MTTTPRGHDTTTSGRLPESLVDAARSIRKWEREERFKKATTTLLSALERLKNDALGQCCTVETWQQVDAAIMEAKGDR